MSESSAIADLRAPYRLPLIRAAVDRGEAIPAEAAAWLIVELDRQIRENFQLDDAHRALSAEVDRLHDLIAERGGPDA